MSLGAIGLGSVYTWCTIEGPWNHPVTDKRTLVLDKTSATYETKFDISKGFFETNHSFSSTSGRLQPFLNEAVYLVKGCRRDFEKCKSVSWWKNRLDDLWRLSVLRREEVQCSAIFRRPVLRHQVQDVCDATSYKKKEEKVMTSMKLSDKVKFLTNVILQIIFDEVRQYRLLHYPTWKQNFEFSF
jgi:hypothetical protein